VCERLGRDAGASTIWAAIAAGIHLFPFRTEKLSPPAPMVLGAQAPGRVGRRPPLLRRSGIRSSGFLIATIPEARRLRRRGRSYRRVAPWFVDFAPVELRDGDLLLRAWGEADVPALVEACNDEQIAYWIPVIPRPYSEADALSFVRGESPGVPEHSYAITVDGAVVGAIGMSLNSMKYKGTIGYWTAAPARGQGVCTRALRLLSHSALDELRLIRLELITDPDNLASQRVAEKVGFQREGVLRAHLRHPDGRIRDSVMFSLLPGELRG
jgi:RimJ/RimL family protein N-acetyltransferase